jgi:hypothetical protein
MKKLDIESDPLLKLIAEVGKPIQRGTKDDGSVKFFEGNKDLSEHANSLRELIERAKVAYQEEVDQLKDKLDGRFKKKLDDNAEPETDPDPAYDYSEFIKDARADWAKEYEWYYKRSRGRIHPEPRPLYLYPVLVLIKRWWEHEDKKLGKFQPDFVESPYDIGWCNSAARLFYLVAQECDHRFTLDHCANIGRTLRK